MKKEAGYYVFDCNHEYYLYDMLGNLIVQLEKALYDTLLKYKQEQNLMPEEYTIVNEFLACGLSQSSQAELFDDNKNHNTAYLSFAPTYECNLRCTYCFGKCGNSYKGKIRKFTKSSLKKMLRYFFETAFPNFSQYRIDFVSGGEPLLGVEIIKDAIEYIEKYSNNTNKKVTMWLCTNATLLTDEIIEYLSLHNVSIGISIDGRKEYNDLYRLDANNNGTYELICKGINLIKKNSNVAKKFKNIWGLCTATNQNCDFVDLLHFMHDLGFKSVQIRLVRSKDKYDVSHIKEQYDLLSNFLLETYLKSDLQYIQMVLNDNDQFGKVFKRILLDGVLIRRCDAGVNKLTICPDGTIYPCDSLVGISECILGTIDAVNWNKEFYASRTIHNNNPCKDCEIKYLCGGDCYYNSLMKTGCQFSADSEFCEIQRHIIHKTIVLRYKMEVSNQDLYEKLLKEVRLKNDYSELFG